MLPQQWQNSPHTRRCWWERLPLIQHTHTHSTNWKRNIISDDGGGGHYREASITDIERDEHPLTRDDFVPKGRVSGPYQVGPNLVQKVVEHRWLWVLHKTYKKGRFNTASHIFSFAKYLCQIFQVKNFILKTMTKNILTTNNTRTKRAVISVHC